MSHTRKRRQRPKTTPSITVREYLRTRRVSPAAARALRAALPGGVLPSESTSLAHTVERAAARTSQSPLEVLDALGGFAAWCYERDPARQMDLALHLVQNELHRRHHGAAPRTVTLADPPIGAPLDADGVRGVIVHWEATSYAAGLARPEDGFEDDMTRFCVALRVIGLLATTDGVPVRFDRLDPDAFMEQLEEAPAELGGIARPAIFTSWMLDGAAELYARLVDHGAIDAKTGHALAARLRALSALADREREVAVA